MKTETFFKFAGLITLTVAYFMLAYFMFIGFGSIEREMRSQCIEYKISIIEKSPFDFNAKCIKTRDLGNIIPFNKK